MKDKYYYKDGSILDYRDYDKVSHREDGPAIECVEGDKYWHINGKRHRENGPAVELADGYKAWYLDDVKYSKEDFKAKLKQIDSIPTIVKLTHPEEWIRKRAKREKR